MLALYRSGRQADALEAYHDARRALVDELGIEPGRELRELQQAILRQDPSLDLARRREAPRRAARGRFVGREAELAELAAGLDDAFAGRGRLFLLVRRARHRQEPAGGGARARAQARGARMLVGRCWEAGGAPPTGRGCSRSARTCARPSRGPARGSSEAAPPTSRSCCRSSTSLLRPRRAAAARGGERALPALRRGRLRFSRACRRSGRSCSSSTTCTPPTSRRSCSCSSSPASSRERGSS